MPLKGRKYVVPACGAVLCNLNRKLDWYSRRPVLAASARNDSELKNCTAGEMV